MLLACAPDVGDRADTRPLAEETGDPADTTAAGDTGCAGVPLLSWGNFGHAFLLENCQGCHASTAPDRYGAPEASTFDTVEDAWRQADRILARAWADDATMPPSGGVSADDRTRLGWWLTCGEEGE